MQPRSTVDEGAVALMNLVTAPSLTNGMFYNGLRESRANPQAYNDSARARLRTISDSLIARKR